VGEGGNEKSPFTRTTRAPGNNVSFIDERARLSYPGLLNSHVLCNTGRVKKRTEPPRPPTLFLRSIDSRRATELRFSTNRTSNGPYGFTLRACCANEKPATRSRLLGDYYLSSSSYTSAVRHVTVCTSRVYASGEYFVTVWPVEKTGRNFVSYARA